MKKLIVTLLSIVMALSICSCGGGSAAEDVSFDVTKSEWAYHDERLYYYVELTNLSQDKMIECPTFKITGYDGEEVVGSEDMTLGEIREGATVKYANSISVDRKPTDVKFEAAPVEDYNIKNDEDSECPAPDQLTVKSHKYTYDAEWDDASIKGEIENTSDIALSDVAFTMVFRDEDGKFVYGDTSYVDNVKANGTTPYDVSIYWGKYSTENYEIYLMPWM